MWSLTLYFLFLYVNTIIIFHLGTPQNILWIIVIHSTWSQAFGCGGKAGYQNRMGKNAPDRVLLLKTYIENSSAIIETKNSYMDFRVKNMDEVKKSGSIQVLKIKEK